MALPLIPAVVAAVFGLFFHRVPTPEAARQCTTS